MADPKRLVVLKAISAHLLADLTVANGYQHDLAGVWRGRNVISDGTALPCHTAKMLPGLAFPNVREHDVRHIWFDSEGFNRYRGTGWMKEPCASCDQREVDLGGCRCQAYMLAHDPAATDPVCIKSPLHHLVTDAVAQAEAEFRDQVGAPVATVVAIGLEAYANGYQADRRPSRTRGQAAGRGLK